jgi:hypothetical protein
MSKAIIGSHNSMSYLEPRDWHGKLLRFAAKCQRKTIKEQYFEYGVRCFDFRIFFDDNGRCFFKHGIVWFDTFSMFEHLEFLNKQGDCWLRVLLEETKSDSKKHNIDFIEGKFINMCRLIEEIYPNIRVFGGERKWDWKKIYEFKEQTPDIRDLYSSTTCLFDDSRHGKDNLKDKIDDWWPWLYAKLKNKKNMKYIEENPDNADIVLIDFVDIR